MKLVRDGARTREISAKLGRYAGSVKQMTRAMGLLLKKQIAFHQLRRPSRSKCGLRTAGSQTYG